MEPDLVCPQLLIGNLFRILDSMFLRPLHEWFDGPSAGAHCGSSVAVDGFFLQPHIPEPGKWSCYRPRLTTLSAALVAQPHSGYILDTWFTCHD